MVAQYDPALQASQPLDPVEASNVPVAQLEHALAPAPEYFPVAHCAVTAERPVAAQYEPEPSTKHAHQQKTIIPSPPVYPLLPDENMHTKGRPNKKDQEQDHDRKEDQQGRKQDKVEESTRAAPSVPPLHRSQPLDPVETSKRPDGHEVHALAPALE